MLSWSDDDCIRDDIKKIIYYLVEIDANKKLLPQIDNPAYKGPWVHPEIDNPEYTPDSALYKRDELCAVGLDLWQVKAGTIFDNLLFTDDPETAKERGEEIKKKVEGEKKVKNEQDEAEREKEKAEKPEDEDDEDLDDEAAEGAPVVCIFIYILEAF